METIKISLEPIRLNELFDQDIFGRNVPIAKSTKRIFIISASVQLNDKYLNSLLKIYVNNERTQSEIPKQAILKMFMDSISSKIKSGYIINFFTTNDLGYCNDELSEVNPTELDYHIELSIPDDIFKTLSEQASKYFLAIEDFDFALDRLRFYAGCFPEYIKQSMSEINKYIFHINYSLKNAEVFNLEGWNSEKLSLIRSYFDSLSSRKNMNHPNYQTISNHLRDILFSFQSPNVWISTPPILDR